MTTTASETRLRVDTDRFSGRHIGPRDGDVTAMLETLGLQSLEQLIHQAVPRSIRMDRAFTVTLPLATRNDGEGRRCGVGR